MTGVQTCALPIWMGPNGRDILGITVLVVEHDMKLVMSISDQICVLDSGKILALGKPDEVKNHPDVIKVFLGDEAHA